MDKRIHLLIYPICFMIKICIKFIKQKLFYEISCIFQRENTKKKPYIKKNL